MYSSLVARLPAITPSLRDAFGNDFYEAHLVAFAGPLRFVFGIG